MPGLSRASVIGPLLNCEGGGDQVVQDGFTGNLHEADIVAETLSSKVVVEDLSC